MIKVGVIRGGFSNEYELSLKTGASTLSCLRSSPLNEKYKAVDIFIDKNGIWHINGIPTDISKLSHKVDVVFNALHGDYGEDGKVQQELELWGIPYTGSGPLASSIGYNKLLTKEFFARLGVNTPKHILISAYLEDMDGPKSEYAQKKSHEVLSLLPPPWVVKPLTGGSGMGIHLCKTYNDLVFAFQTGVNEKISVLVEELIEGKKASVTVLDNFRNKEIYTLPPIEIKISEDTCPGNFTKVEKAELERLASLIHNELDLSHYSQSDFIIHPKKGIYALEVNTLLKISQESKVLKSLHAVGSNISEFLDHILKLAINKK